jgi:tetratricopeptide (TPR) repeat protein
MSFDLSVDSLGDFSSEFYLAPPLNYSDWNGYQITWRDIPEIRSEIERQILDIYISGNHMLAYQLATLYLEQIQPRYEILQVKSVPPNRDRDGQPTTQYLTEFYDRYLHEGIQKLYEAGVVKDPPPPLEPISPTNYPALWAMETYYLENGISLSPPKAHSGGFKDFWNEHKQAIIIAAVVIVVAVTVVVIIVTTAGTGTNIAVATGAAAVQAAVNGSDSGEDTDLNFQNFQYDPEINEGIHNFAKAIGAIDMSNTNGPIPIIQASSLSSEITPEILTDLVANWNANLNAAQVAEATDIPPYRGPLFLNTMGWQARGDWALSSGHYTQAVQDFERAIELEPNNPDSYLGRGIANFELGRYEESASDYQNYVAETRQSFSATEFSIGFAKGLPKGIYDSGEGMLMFISDLASHPIQTGEKVYDSISTLSNLAKSGEWNLIAETLSPELHQLVSEWDTLSAKEKGELSGYAFGKHGADILLPGGAAKAVAKGSVVAKELGAICKNLQSAEKILVLEAVAEGGAAGINVVKVIQNSKISIAEKLGFNSHEVTQLEKIANIERGVPARTSNILPPTQEITFTNHALERAIQRGVSKESILDTLASPLKIEDVKIDSLGRPSQRFIGQKAEVVINPETKQVVSVNPTSTKKYEKLTNETGHVQNKIE